MTDFALWNSSFFAKPAVNGQATPWHQDGEYWPIRPLATCTVWVAVDDATRENGCLRFIRGSHRSGRLLSHRTNSSPDLTLNQELVESEYDEEEAVDLVLEAGRISLHDVFLAHGSEANDSPRPRRGVAVGCGVLSGCSGNILVFGDKLPYLRHELRWDFHHGLLGVE